MIADNNDQVEDKGQKEGEELGRRIREARARNGWSLAEVSSRSGLSRAYINSLERGMGRRPGADVMRRLEDALGVLREPPDYDQADVPAGLQALASERRLPSSQVRVLAELRVRGLQPESAARWRFIYDALVASEAMEALPSNGDERPQE